MKRISSVAILATSLLWLSRTAAAQDCGDWKNSDLRGTYTMSGSGFIDLSKVFRGAGLPSGMMPMSWVGAMSYNGVGGGGGWVSFNAGGSEMNAQLTDLTYSMRSDCSLRMSFSMKIKELGVTIGPIPRLAVIVPKPSELELHMILGHTPGSPTGDALDLGVAHRVSMQY